MNFKGLKIKEDNQQLDIYVKWNTEQKIWDIIFVVIIFIFSTILSVFLLIKLDLENFGDLIILLFPLSFFFFPGLLVYKAFQAKFNYTHLKIDNDSIKIKKEPISIKHNIDKIPIKDLVQIYLKKDKITDKYREKIKIYELKALLKNNESKFLLDSELIQTPEMGTYIEEKIETFLKIPDFAIYGEYKQHSKPSRDELARNTDSNNDPINYELNDLQEQGFLTYQNESYQVTYKLQFDWLDGQTDFFYQLVNGSNQSLAIYLKQDMGLKTPWKESRLKMHQVESILNHQSPSYKFPSDLNFNLEIYYKTYAHKGKSFADSHQTGLNVEMSFYTDKTGEKSIRLIKYAESGKIEGFEGVKEVQHSFSNIIPAG